MGQKWPNCERNSFMVFVISLECGRDKGDEVWADISFLYC